MNPSQTANVAKQPELLGKYHAKEARDTFARMVGLSDVAITDILERRYGAGLNLAERMARVSGIPLRTWINWKYSLHSVWHCPPHTIVGSLPTPLNPWLSDDYRAQHALVVKWARMVGVRPARIWSFLYRRNVPSPRLAMKLQLASDVSADAWLAAISTSSPEFRGKPADARLPAKSRKRGGK